MSAPLDVVTAFVGTLMIIGWLGLLLSDWFEEARWERAKERHRRAYPGEMERSEAKAKVERAVEQFERAATAHEKKPTAQSALRMRHWRRRVLDAMRQAEEAARL